LARRYPPGSGRPCRPRSGRTNRPPVRRQRRAPRLRQAVAESGPWSHGPWSHGVRESEAGIVPGRASDKPGAAYFGFSAAVPPCRAKIQARQIGSEPGRPRVPLTCPVAVSGSRLLARAAWAGSGPDGPGRSSGSGASVRRTVVGNGPSQAPGYSFGSFIQKFEVSGESRGTNPGLGQTCPHARSRCPDEERPGQEEPDRTKTESVSMARDPKRRRKEGPDRLTCPGGRSG